MEIKFRLKSNESFVFRELNDSDGIQLGNFFELLSNETHSKFGPHPLTKEYAFLLCKNIGNDNVSRFIILDAAEIIGYFILDFNFFEHDTARYRKYGIELNSKIDPMFAPCIADRYQGLGIAGHAMKILMNYAKSKNLRSLVLMGGTQKPNIQAQNFYKKFGFKKFGEFYTEHNGLNNIDMMLTIDRK